MKDSIGALWIKNGKYGEFYAGNIEIKYGDKTITKKITVSKNIYKKDNQPDFRIYEAKSKEEKQEQFEVPQGDDLPF